MAPLVAVFVEALADGVVASLKSHTSPDARDAIRLTLTIAAVSVTLNAAFGIAVVWLITKFDFRGKAFLITLIDLPFSVSPVTAAVHPVSRAIHSGTLVALLGPSGSGKTTLLRILGGHEYPTSGRILLDGKDATGLTVQDRRAGFVFQS